jgi:hypothetical protein
MLYLGEQQSPAVTEPLLRYAIGALLPADVDALAPFRALGGCVSS